MPIISHTQGVSRGVGSAFTACITPPNVDINPVSVQKIIITVTFNFTLGTGGTAIAARIMRGAAGAILATVTITKNAGETDGGTIRLEDTPDFLANGGSYRLQCRGIGQTVNGTFNFGDVTMESWPE